MRTGGQDQEIANPSNDWSRQLTQGHQASAAIVLIPWIVALNHANLPKTACEGPYTKCGRFVKGKYQEKLTGD